MFRHYLSLILILITIPALAAENPDIRELMTPEEFTASGLSRLSNDEMDAINLWLVRYTAQDAEEILRSSPAVQEVSRADVRSRIDGEFTGWNGPTRFTLKNGHVYETNSSRSYSYSAIDPEVEITRNWMGIYKLRILATDKAINVRRIE
jgi:hypothetical protein